MDTECSSLQLASSLCQPCLCAVRAYRSRSRLAGACEPPNTDHPYSRARCQPRPQRLICSPLCTRTTLAAWQTRRERDAYEGIVNPVAGVRARFDVESTAEHRRDDIRGKVRRTALIGSKCTGAVTGLAGIGRRPQTRNHILSAAQPCRPGRDRTLPADTTRTAGG